jgi:hypothetical protein
MGARCPRRFGFSRSIDIPLSVRWELRGRYPQPISGENLQRIIDRRCSLNIIKMPVEFAHRRTGAGVAFRRLHLHFPDKRDFVHVLYTSCGRASKLSKSSAFTFCNLQILKPAFLPNSRRLHHIYSVCFQQLENEQLIFVHTQVCEDSPNHRLTGPPE